MAPSSVRRAAQAFLTMRERLERYLQQRTEMLAGVSHDLKTPLTRIRLQLAMLPPSADIDAMRSDIIEMERMLDEYLQFARGEGGEQAELCDLSDLVRDAAARAVRARGAGPDRLTLAVPQSLLLSVRRHALSRCLTNLIDNALKHGKHVAVSLGRDERFAQILVDDDGPGIPETLHEEAFRPFHRLDEGPQPAGRRRRPGPRHRPRHRPRPWRRPPAGQKSPGRPARHRPPAGVSEGRCPTYIFTDCHPRRVATAARSGTHRDTHSDGSRRSLRSAGMTA